MPVGLALKKIPAPRNRSVSVPGASTVMCQAPCWPSPPETDAVGERAADREDRRAAHRDVEVGDDRIARGDVAEGTAEQAAAGCRPCQWRDHWSADARWRTSRRSHASRRYRCQGSRAEFPGVTPTPTQRARKYAGENRFAGPTGNRCTRAPRSRCRRRRARPMRAAPGRHAARSQADRRADAAIDTRLAQPGDRAADADAVGLRGMTGEIVAAGRDGRGAAGVALVARPPAGAGERVARQPERRVRIAQGEAELIAGLAVQRIAATEAVQAWPLKG